MVKQFRTIKNYIKYIKSHRAINESYHKSNMWKYSTLYRVLLTIEYTLHDLNKIFSLHILDYAKQHDIYTYHFEGYDGLLCWHDTWAIKPITSQPNKYPILNRLLNNRRNHTFSSYDEIIDFCDELFELCKSFGEDCTSFYLRNYKHFNITSAADRYYIEKGLCISFNKYLYEYEEGLCIYEIFDTSNHYYDDQFAKYVGKTLLLNFGVNIYEALDINEPSGELEEFEDFCEEG